MPANTNAVEYPKAGCYYLKLLLEKPVADVAFYHGTLRLERRTVRDFGLSQALESSGLSKTLAALSSGPAVPGRPDLAKGEIETLRASADLYAFAENPAKSAAAALNDFFKESQKRRAAGEAGPIPCFPRKDYYGYMEETAVYRGGPPPASNAESPMSLSTRLVAQNSPVRSPGRETLGARFHFHRFDHATLRFGSQGHLTVTVKQDPANDDRYEGQLINEDGGQIVARLEMTWLSPHLREVIVQIDAVSVPQIPAESRPGQPDSVSWAKAFEPAGWKVVPDIRRFPEDAENPKAPESKTLLTELRKLKFDLSAKWTDNELHAAMSLLRGQDSFDSEWRYHLLCIGEFANPRYERGVMYDVAGVDTDEAPRGGAAIAAFWPIPKKAPAPSARAARSAAPSTPSTPPDPRAEHWEGVAAQFFGDATDLYFRTAIHEVGHEMGLDHSGEDTGFMNTTDELARRAGAAIREKRDQAIRWAVEGHFLPAPGAKAREFASRLAQRRKDLAADAEKNRFPKNVRYAFSEKDLRRLRHGPDVMVRPGAFSNENLPAFGDEQAGAPDGLELRVSPFHAAVTYGAPVRIHLRLTNISHEDQTGFPNSLNLKAGFVSGEVIDPRGKSNPFEALLRSADESRQFPGELKPGHSQCHTMTLLRGNLGPLFGREGTHRVRVRVEWNRSGRLVRAEHETTVEITPPADAPQRVAAVRILNTPRALFALALGENQDPDTEAALLECCNDRSLGPHYRVIQLKRRIRAINKGNAGTELASLLEMIDQAVLSVSELLAVSRLLHEHHEYARDLDSYREAALLFRDKLTALFRREVNEFYT